MFRTDQEQLQDDYTPLQKRSSSQSIPYACKALNGKTREELKARDFCDHCEVS
ncbi:hypothetical protein OCU04_013033 [Sclerotinia nivalis]|uniref:Uncharacterized protein n=1 Tax=Sclerotinia nivalis TaxID=352851 RepID=A0A9X0A7U1_9HELO|nr:hypothetical protein OCU04_013033 [Sclerotinia nivalis]